jgi:23S rRNA G2445 N2-methylase RlmL
MRVDHLRIVGSPQTNRVMEAELIRVAKRALGRRPADPRREGTGQLVYPFDPELALVAVTYLRTPTRVVRDLYRVDARHLEPLYAELAGDVRHDDRRWTAGRRRLSVEVRRVQGFAAGERQIVGTVKNALVDGLASHGAALRVDPDDPELLVVARMDDDGRLVVSLDLGAGSRSQRGWRIETGDAPLREHLAAVLLMEARFDPRVDVLVDPLCGAGTIPIEGSLLARGVARPVPPVAAALAPRSFTEPLFGDATPLIVGQDLDTVTLAAAHRNAIDAGARDVIWRRGDATALEPDAIGALAAERGRAAERGVFVTNPPYGERLGATDDDRLLALYADLGRAMRRFRGWRAGILAAHPAFEHAFGGKPSMKKPLANAQLRSYFFVYDF